MDQSVFYTKFFVSLLLPLYSLIVYDCFFDLLDITLEGKIIRALISQQFIAKEIVKIYFKERKESNSINWKFKVSNYFFPYHKTWHSHN